MATLLDTGVDEQNQQNINVVEINCNTSDIVSASGGNQSVPPEENRTGRNTTPAPGKGHKPETEKKPSGKERKRRRSPSSSSEDETSESQWSDDSDQDSGSDSSSESSSNEKKKPKKAKAKKTKKSKVKVAKKSKKAKKSSRFQLGESEDSQNWDLSKDLADYLNQNIISHQSDETIKKDILENCPVPANVYKIPGWPKSGYIKRAVDNKKFVKIRDAKLKRLGEKVRAIYAPLTAVWSMIDRFRSNSSDNPWSMTLSNGNKEVSVDVDVVASRLDQSITLTGQAVNAVNYFRRTSILSTLCADDDKAKELMEECQEAIEEEPEELFGKAAKKALSREAKLEGMKLDQFLRSKGSGSRRSRGRSFHGRPFSSGSRGRSGTYGSTEFFHHDNYDQNQSLLSRSPRGKSPKDHLQHSDVSSQSVLEPLRNGKYHTFGKKSLPFTMASNAHSSRSSKVFSKSLGKGHKRSKHPGSSFGLENSIFRKSRSNIETQATQAQCRGRSLDLAGDFQNAGVRSHSGSKPLSPSVRKLHFSSREKRWVSKTHHKSKISQPVHRLPKVQNGDPQGRQAPHSSRRFHVQNRPERCLLPCTSSLRVKKVRKIRVEGKALRRSLPDVRISTRPQEIYQTSEGCRRPIEKTEHSPGYLHRRHHNSSLVGVRGRTSERHNSVSAPGTRFLHKLGQIHSGPHSYSRVSRSSHKQRVHDILHPRRKTKKTHGSMRTESVSEAHIPLETLKSYGEAESNSTSFHPSTPPNEVPSTGDNQTHPERTLVLKKGGSGCQKPSRAKLVGGKHESPKRKPHKDLTSRDGNLHGRSHVRRLGGLVRGPTSRGSLVGGRKRQAHQRARNVGSKICPHDFPKNQESSVCSSSSRQHNSPQLPSKYGGNKSTRTHRHCQGSVAVSVVDRDHNYARIHPFRTEYRSRLGIKKLEGQQRMEARSILLPKPNEESGNAGCRPVCISDSPSGPKIYKLETRPLLLSSGCIPTKLETLSTPLCIPSFLSDRRVLEKGHSTPIKVDTSGTAVANPTLVPDAAENGNQSAIDFTVTPINTERPKRGIPPSRTESNAHSDGLAGVGENKGPRVFSKPVADLLAKSRSEGTRKNYESLWKAFASWCSGRQTNPFSCDLNTILDYLTSLFHRGLEYRTINNHRSAISCFHPPVQGIQVGKHPTVVQLLKGVSNERPPQPKSYFTWNVSQVLNYIRSLPDNEFLNRKTLSLKTLTLLAVCQINRSKELAGITVKFMSHHDDYTQCGFGIRVKHSRKGTSTPPIYFHCFHTEPKVCPVTCLRFYEDVTKEDRKAQNTSGFFLALNRPHHPVSKTTLARWLIEFLALAGIDTSHFTAHSVRSAASSKAANRGVGIKDILKQGNWSSEDVWQNFYHKNVHDEKSPLVDALRASKAFQKAILSD